MQYIVKEKYGLEPYLKTLEDLTAHGQMDVWLEDFSHELDAAMALDNGKIIGWAGYIRNEWTESKENTSAEIGVFVKPEYRGKGIAKKLVDEILHYEYVTKGVKAGKIEFASELFAPYKSLADKYHLKQASIIDTVLEEVRSISFS